MKALYLAAALMMVSAPTLAADGPFCSGRGHEKVTLEFGAGDEFTVRHGKKSEHWVSAGSVGTGMPGFVYKSTAGEIEVRRDLKVVIDGNPTPPDERPVIIFQDRAFWPCKP